MTKSRAIHNVEPKSDQLTVRFVRQLPNEEVVYFARRCALKGGISGPLTIVLEAQPAALGQLVHEVRVEQEGEVVISETDPDIMLAVRNAFDRLATSYGPVPAVHRRVPVAAVAEASKLWS